MSHCQPLINPQIQLTQSDANTESSTNPVHTGDIEICVHTTNQNPTAIIKMAPKQTKRQTNNRSINYQNSPFFALSWIIIIVVTAWKIREGEVWYPMDHPPGMRGSQSQPWDQSFSLFPSNHVPTKPVPKSPEIHVFLIHFQGVLRICITSSHPSGCTTHWGWD